MKISNESLRRNVFKTHFYESVSLVGKFGFPQIYSQIDIPLEAECLPFNVFMSKDNKQDCGVHFFIDDYYFERIWNNVDAYLPALKKAKFVLGPDFSVYADMPVAVQIFNTYRNRAITAYLQERGVKIIPVASWSDIDSFEWCFDALPKNSLIAIGTGGALQNRESKEQFLNGYAQMLNVLSPHKVIIVGRVPSEIDTQNVINIPSYSQIVCKKLKGGI